jgi:hypothetical protein
MALCQTLSALVQVHTWWLCKVHLISLPGTFWFFCLLHTQPKFGNVLELLNLKSSSHIPVISFYWILCVSFPSLPQTPEIINLWRRKFNYGSQFWRFQSMMGRSIALGLWQEQTITTGPHGRNWEIGGHRGPMIPFKNTPPVSWRPSTRPHLLKLPPPLRSTRLRAKSLTHETSRNIPDSSYNIWHDNPLAILHGEVYFFERQMLGI